MPSSPKFLRPLLPLLAIAGIVIAQATVAVHERPLIGATRCEILDPNAPEPFIQLLSAPLAPR
jgi:hypothetical protein